MNYTLAVPELAPGAAVPLVVALHYAGSVRQHFAEEYLRILAEPGLRSLGAIIFAPDVLGPSWIEPLSEDAVVAFVRQAAEAWPVDPDRVVVTGYSMGGFGAWYLSDKYGTVFSAAVPMAAEPFGSLRGDVPTYIIHGTDDELFDVEFAERAFQELSARGVEVGLGIGEGLSHYQAGAYVPLLQEVVPWLTDTVWAP
jgi:predicted peptidase